ncbi:MAG: YhcH/YjgK/YiaL family protein [Prevotella sp.]|nr:YhcH/YjgK/YiaL family protein [Prevotella sp.]MCR5151786.1 YhcH/YjgK/YiaL family protein [Prevotella sp.]
MIVDTLDNLKNYVGCNKYFADIVKFIEENDLASLEEGKHFIHEKALFVNIQTAKGKTKEEATFETHRRMLDIQIPLDAPETYGYIPLKDMPEQEYNAEKDVTKYPGVEAQSYVTCYPGMFAIFFPQDGHQPCISDAPQIKKAIFKAEV